MDRVSWWHSLACLRRCFSEGWSPGLRSLICFAWLEPSAMSCPVASPGLLSQAVSYLQPAPDSSPMKRSISTLAPQRSHVTHLCNTPLDRAPASQPAPHHHHRCHRRRDRKQKSLEKGPSLCAENDGGMCTVMGEGAEPLGALLYLA